MAEDSDFPLAGTLSIPAEQDIPVPAVVLVHGSGPSDRNQAVFGYQIFKDLAHGLAEQGIATLRYDKRTYSYPSEFDLEQFTIMDESIEDTLSAISLLENDDRINSDAIYLIGHSQGAMIAPRIYSLQPNLAGLILLAGSPRSLWKIIYDQNMAVLADLDSESIHYQTNKTFVEAEFERAKQLTSQSFAEVYGQTIFGIPAFYLKELDSFDTKEALLQIDIPLLIMQGEQDFQVTVNKDYQAYQDLLNNNLFATFMLYSNLNHFFVDYQGDKQGTVEEYMVEAEMDAQVIDDIANWLLKQEN
ncbi:hypothetical protein SAMN04488134_101722 [Amphibacillus marinus]|uniref:AB hydrolase-1 domain-containing protein n=1 Tax=Amphibacillus marinus TaxID=872970 RepID=A0A1H8ITQ8_9BACI|nr:alpha/beta hydrolase [Amphibacillus marinus]SEN71801.1 hypothetical protein SAMN04488134_101722 [Amphibacillus marinus]